MPILGEYEEIKRHVKPMEISVKGKNLDVGGDLRSHVGAHLDGALDWAAERLRRYKRNLGNHHAKNQNVDDIPPAPQYWLYRSGQHGAMVERIA